MPAFFVHGVPDTSALWDGVRANIERDDVDRAEPSGVRRARCPRASARRKRNTSTG